jgi:hypothetical protein
MRVALRIEINQQKVVYDFPFAHPHKPSAYLEVEKIRGKRKVVLPG